MFKRISSIFITITILACTLCACGGSKDVNLVVPIKSDPLCLDPQIAETDSSRLIVSNCYEGLVRLNESYEIIPGVAQTWEVSNNGLTYTFHLRTDTNWQLLKSFSDVLEDENYLENFKTTVTAHDFEFALKRAVDPLTQANDAEKLLCIKNAEAISKSKADKSTLGVNAVDDSTLVINLSRANDDFLRLLSLPICMPCNEEFFNATHAKYGLELKYTFCNGPFYLGKWVDDNSLTIYKNEGYKGETKVSTTGVYFYVNSDEDAVLKSIKQNSYDCAYLSNAALSQLNSNKNVNRINAANIINGLCFNCTDSVLKNVNIRKAILMMTNTDLISSSDSTIRESGIIPGCCRFGNERYRDVAGEVPTIQYNEAKAVELWEKGLKELDIDSAGIAIICTEEMASPLQEIIQKWQKLIGTQIIAKVEIMTESEINDAINADTYQIAFSSITTSSSTAVDILKTFSTNDSNNIFNYSDATYDKTLNNIIHTYSSVGLINGYKAAEKRIIGNAVFCPVFSSVSGIAVSKNVTGLSVSPALESISFINGGRS